jgi:hypothetical protein
VLIVVSLLIVMVVRVAAMALVAIAIVVMARHDGCLYYNDNFFSSGCQILVRENEFLGFDLESVPRI